MSQNEPNPAKPTHKKPRDLFRFTDEFLAAWQMVYRPVIAKSVTADELATMDQEVQDAVWMAKRIESLYTTLAPPPPTRARKSKKPKEQDDE